jgi:dynein heavy chain 2
MLPCQQALLLDAALAFEKLVKTEKQGKETGASSTTVTWDNPAELEAYIEKLQGAAERLTTQNRRLRKAHQLIADKVASLMHVDLLRQMQVWKDTTGDIRAIFKDIERQGFNPANMRPWLAHWDRQLYKVLEFQYQLGLESLHQQVPEIKAELIFRCVTICSLISYLYLFVSDSKNFNFAHHWKRFVPSTTEN